MLFKNVLKRATLFVALGVLLVISSSPTRAGTTTVAGLEKSQVVVKHKFFMFTGSASKLTISGVPSGANLVPDENPRYDTLESGHPAHYESTLVYWIPNYCQSGSYLLRFNQVITHLSDGSLFLDTSDYYLVTISNVNRPPAFPQTSDTILEYPKHPGQVTYEAKDPDADTCHDDAIVYTAESLPPGTSVTTRSSVTLSWSNIPAGSYDAMVIATDLSGASETLNVHFDVRQPTIEMRGDNALQVSEGSSIAFNAWAKAMTNGEVDPSLTVVLKVDSLPPGAIPTPDDSVSSPGQAVIPISWEPGYCSAGGYQLKYTAKIYYDGSLLEQKITRETVTAININRVPSVSHSGPDSVAIYQGVPVNVQIIGFDADFLECGDDVLLLSVLNKPSSATFVDSGNGHGSFSWNTKGNPKGTSSFSFIATDNSGSSDTIAMKVTLLPTGDANGDSKLNLADIIYVVNYIFKGGPPSTPHNAMDANCDGKVNLSDIVYLVNYIFKGGPLPCPAS